MLLVSPLLLAELRRALGYPKLARLVPPADADALVALLGRTAAVAANPPGPPPGRSADPDDDYPVTLAADRIPVRRRSTGAGQFAAGASPDGRSHDRTGAASSAV